MSSYVSIFCRFKNGLVVGAYAVGKAKFRLTNFGECLNHYVKRNLNKELSLSVNRKRSVF